MTAASELMRTRQLSPVDYLSAFLSRIDRYDGALDAFISVDRDRALAAAQVAEREIGQGQWRGVLHGIPVALKDIFDVAGQPSRRIPGCGRAMSRRATDLSSGVCETRAQS